MYYRLGWLGIDTRMTMKRKEDFENTIRKNADDICHQWGEEGGITYEDLIKMGKKCMEYGYKCGREDMAHTMSVVVQGKLMTFTNDENERILPPLPLAMFITEIYNESMAK